MPPSVHDTRRRFDEYSTLEYLLIGDLRAALDDTAGEDAQRWLADAVAALVESMPNKLQLTLELDAVVISLAPQDKSAVFGDLHAAQRQLLADLEAILGGLQSSPASEAILVETTGIPGPAPTDLTELARRLHDWLDQLAEHNRDFARTACDLFESMKPPKRGRGAAGNQ